MNTDLEFIERSEKERIAFKQIIDILFKDKKIIYYTTDVYSKDKYDGSVSVICPETGSIIKRYTIEVKIRDTHYDELLYEKIKHNALTQIRKEFDSEILYFNITPKGSYIFRINKLVDSYTKWETRQMPKSTVLDTKDVDKKCIFLPISEAKYINITTANINHQYLINKELERTKNIVTKKKDIGFLIDFNDNEEKNNI